MATNWKGVQVAETMDGKVKERRPPGDTNIKQMSGGSWLSSLSKGGHPSRNLKGRAVAERPKGKR